VKGLNVQKYAFALSLLARLAYGAFYKPLSPSFSWGRTCFFAGKTAKYPNFYKYIMFDKKGDYT